MEDKKDIGKAFREKLDSLDRMPSDALWDTISKDLDKKKKRQLPFWFYICGSLLAIVCLVYFITQLSPDNNATVTKQDNLQNDNSNFSPASTSVKNNSVNEKAFEDGDVNGLEDSQNKENNAVDTHSTVTDVTTSTAKRSSKLRNNSKTKSATDKIVIETGTSSKNNREQNNATIGAHHKQKKQNLNETASVGNSKTAKKGSKSKKHSTSSYSSKTKTALSSGNRNTKSYDAVDTTSISKKRDKKTSGKSKITGEIADFSSGKQTEKQSGNAPGTAITTPNTGISSEMALREGMPATTQDSLPENILIQKDTLKTELPKEKVAEESKKDSLPPVIVKRFSVFAYGGPSLFNFPNRNIVTETTTSNINTKSSTRFGVLFGYRLNSKLRIRTGLSVYKLKQSAANIKLNYTMDGGSATNPELIPSADFSWIDYEQPFGTNSGQIINTLGENYQAIINIDRKLSYFEIPLEIGYTLLDNKFGLNIFGGGSILLLTKNEVYAYNEKGRMYLGAWNAAAKTSLTGTLGLGLHYNFSPFLQVNAEPTFNYYFNTYKDSKPSSFTTRVGMQYNFDIGSKKK